MKKVAWFSAGLCFLGSSLSFAQPVVIKMGNVFATRHGAMPGHMTRVQEHLTRVIANNTNGEVVWESARGQETRHPALHHA